MEGIQYITDEKGVKHSAVINLDVYGDIWEDLYDILVMETRKHEPRVSWEDVKKSIHKKRK